MWEVQREIKSSGSVHEKTTIKERGLFRELTRSVLLWKGNMGLSLIFLFLNFIYHAFLPSRPMLSLFVSCGRLISISLFISLPFPRLCCKNQSPEFGFCSCYCNLHMQMNPWSPSSFILCSTAAPETDLVTLSSPISSPFFTFFTDPPSMPMPWAACPLLARL